MLLGHYREVCPRKGCSARMHKPAPTLAKIAGHRMIMVAILMLASMFMGSMLALIVHAQNSLPERVGIVEAEQQSESRDTTRLSSQILVLEQKQAEDRDRIAEQQSQISTMKGIGIGLGALVMILQAFGMLLGIRRGGE